MLNVLVPYLSIVYEWREAITIGLSGTSQLFFYTPTLLCIRRSTGKVVSMDYALSYIPRVWIPSMQLNTITVYIYNSNYSG